MYFYSLSDKYFFTFFIIIIFGHSKYFTDYSTNIVINMAGYRGIINSEMAIAIVFNNILLNRIERFASTVY